MWVINGHLIICSFCGAENTIYEYVEAIDCYICKKNIKFNEDTKKFIKERFSDGVKYQRPKDNESEKEIFKSLNLSEAERKYIYFDKDSVIFRFPLKINVEIEIGGNLFFSFGDIGFAWGGEHILSEDTEKQLEEAIYKKIERSFDDELKKGAFKIGDFRPDFGEVWFYKDIHNIDEVKEAVKWLVDFKKRFRF